jgi:hypothetical protein
MYNDNDASSFISTIPPGKFYYEVSKDLNRSTQIFNEYNTAVGPGVPSDRREQSCDYSITMSLSISLECTRCTIQSEVRGYIDIGRGVEG